MKKRSKRYKNFNKVEASNKKIDVNGLIENVKKTSTTKFDESVDVSMKINLKQSKGGDFSLRTVVKLPNGNGKKLKIAVLCEQDKINDAKSNGADICGSQDLLDNIAAGKINFSKLVCTPSMMSKLGKHGKVLGPKGLMPNPKLGTVSNDLKKSIKDLKNGLVEVKNDKDGNIAVSIGRKSFSNEKILENLKYLIESIKKEKPDAIKGEFIKNIFITSTMGLSYKLNGKI